MLVTIVSGSSDKSSTAAFDTAGQKGLPKCVSSHMGYGGLTIVGITARTLGTGLAEVSTMGKSPLSSLTNLQNYGLSWTQVSQKKIVSDVH